MGHFRPVIYAGIDEAGYGPLLGPLCVGCAAFVLPDAGDAPATSAADAPPPCLWKALSAAVCRATNDKRRRIAVEDSKKKIEAHEPVRIEPPRVEIPKSARVQKEKQVPLFEELPDSLLPPLKLLDPADENIETVSH
jgi:hypothetical protein